ncbi:MAG TPA: MarR family transcriptional regulator [Kineosporiaceae bacterium]|nr:MarR family transcriptional regulator [Kineosporiaceae bacterium]
MGDDAVRWLDDHEQQVWRAYLDVMRLLMDLLQRQAAEGSGMSLGEYEVLVQLSEAPDRQLRMSQLADRIVHSRSRLTHTVGRMERRGLVRREPCEDDGRGVLCALTDEGFAVLVEAAPGHVEAVRSALFDLLDPQDVDALGVAMEKVRARLRPE